MLCNIGRVSVGSHCATGKTERMREVDTRAGKCISLPRSELNRPCLAQSLAYWIPPSPESDQSFTYCPPSLSRGHCVDSHVTIPRHTRGNIPIT